MSLDLASFVLLLLLSLLLLLALLLFASGFATAFGTSAAFAAIAIFFSQSARARACVRVCVSASIVRARSNGEKSVFQIQIPTVVTE